MGAPILHMGAMVKCAHQGTATPIITNPRVKVGGQPIVTITSVYSVAGCTNPTPPANVGPCITATWLMGAVRVKAGGMPVLLQNSQSICTPTGTPLTIQQTQTKVTAT